MEPIREAEMQTQPGKRLNEESKKEREVGPLLIAGIVAGGFAVCGLRGPSAPMPVLWIHFTPTATSTASTWAVLPWNRRSQRLETQLLNQAITLVDNEGQPLAHLTVAELGYTAEDFSGDAQFWKNDDQNKGFFKKGWAYLATCHRSLARRCPLAGHGPSRLFQNRIPSDGAAFRSTP